MRLNSYATRVKRDIERWAQSGLIPRETAQKLAADIESRGGSLRFGNVLVIMAAVLLGAAVLIFISANWQAMPRPVRAGGLLALLFCGYVGGAWLKASGRDTLSEAAWLVAACGFGASIALIGQMYHLSGDERQAIAAWAIGTGGAAMLLRSGPLSVGTALLATVWMVASFGDFQDPRSLPLEFLVAAPVIWMLSLWTRSVATRHFLLLSLYLFVVLLFMRTEMIAPPLTLAGAATVLFAADIALKGRPGLLLGIAPGLPLHALLAFLTGAGLVQVDFIDAAALIPISLAVLAGIVAALLAAGHLDRSFRWLAYGAFAIQIAFVYLVTLGTMLGTAGFFLAAGLVLAALAYGVGRFERRMALRAEEAGA